MTRLTTLVCAALLGCACAAQAGSEPAQTQPTATGAGERLVVTERSHGRTLTMRLGRTGTLRVPSRLRGEVRSTGRSVLVIRIDTFAPTDTRDWELRAVRIGSTVLTGPRRDGSRFRVTVRVIR